MKTSLLLFSILIFLVLYNPESPDPAPYEKEIIEKMHLNWEGKWGENMYLEKVILNNNGRISEVIVKNYQLIDSYTVATEIDFYNNGKLYMDEKYFDVSFPENVNQEIFEPKNFSELKW